MKRLLLLIGVVMALGIESATAQVAKITLSHNGQLTMYNSGELATAIKSSVAGDTIFLTEGTFTGNVNISHPISLIGAGQNTIIDGFVEVVYSGNLTARMLDALYINGNVYAGTSDGLIIRKCKFTYFYGEKSSNALLDRCYCTSDFYLTTNVKNMQVVNSVISEPHGKASDVGDVNFVNCNILHFDYSDCVKATFINCIVKNNYKQPVSYFSYSRIYDDNGKNTMQNCKMGSFNWSNTYEYNPGMTGTDGTIVGIYGGTTPFTLVPSNPKVTSYDLSVDAANKKVTVNVSVTAQ